MRELKSIRVTVPRFLTLLVPSTLFVVVQPILLVMQMFDLSFWDHWLVFISCSIIEVLAVLWVVANVINSKGEELYQQRQAELVGIAKKEDDSEAKAKRSAVLSEIVNEATLYGLWLVNASFLISWVFFSFVVVRFWPTSWNFSFASLAASVLSQYLPYQFVKTPSYYAEA